MQSDIGPLKASKSIRTKLMAAFASLAVLVGTTGLIGVWFTLSVGDRATLIGEKLTPLGVDALEIQLNGTEAHLVFEEIMAGDQTESIDQVWSLLEKAKWHANAILKGGADEHGTTYATESPQVREKIQFVIGALDKFVEATKQRLTLRETLSSVGGGIEEDFDKSYFVVQNAIDGLSEAVFGAVGDENRRALRDAGQAKFLIANAHLFLEELIAGDSTESFESVKTDLLNARKLIDGLANASVAHRVPRILTALDEFIALAEARNANLINGSQVGTKVETDYDDVYEMFIKAADEAADVIKSDINAALVDAENYKVNSIYVLLAALTAGLVLAAALAFLIGRTIASRTRAMSLQMEALAAGNLDTQISFTEDSDEIGQMAKSLAVFRESAVERQRFEVEAKLAERRARDESAQATEREILDDLGEMVEAAADGDLSRRVDLTGKAGFRVKIGESVNRWADTIGSAVGQITEVVSALAKGDLTRRVEGDFKGSFLQMKNDTNSMAEKIRAVARRISGASREVQGATREIASGVADLSARTEHQASSLEETSASMEELATTVRQNSGNAQEANALAAAASASAMAGGEIAAKAVAAMGKIEDSSRQIGDIVGLIQDIAFQTNLLALNAAVEAARAGDAGKGFAVVANEVRALAQRAGQASKEIKSLIVNSDTQVREGVSLVKQAGLSLTEIVASVKKVANLVSEIAAATQEQSSGIEQVSKAVSGMDQMTQQNAALVDETNAALHSATSQVDELRKVVSFFKTGDAEVQVKDVTEAEEAYQSVAANRANPVRQQFQALARRVASGGKTAVAHDKWTEF